MQIGFIGLGKMGKNMVLRLLEQAVEVVAWNRSPEPLEEVVKAGARRARDLKDLQAQLPTPRIIWLMLPQGQPTEEILQILKPHLTAGDLVIDGANAYYQDSQRRAEDLRKTGIKFMDVGVSGGPGGARHGACLMVGGEDQDFHQVKWLMEKLAAPEAFVHLGPVGAGHFAKMVHNGIEYGMMEAIAEGAAVLKGSEFGLDLATVFQIYNRRSVIDSRLVGWAQEAFQENGDLEDINPVIGHTGEGEWTIKQATEEKVMVPVIEAAFQVRLNSSKDGPESLDGFRNKVVSALREKFGHHQVKIK